MERQRNHAFFEFGSKGLVSSFDVEDERPLVVARLLSQERVVPWYVVCQFVYVHGVGVKEYCGLFSTFPI